MDSSIFFNELTNLKIRGYNVSSQCLQKLFDRIVSNTWKGVTFDNIGFVGSSGVSLYISYFHILFEISIKPKESERITLNVTNAYSICIEAMWSYGRPEFPILCLKRLMERIKATYPYSTILKNAIVFHDASLDAADKFINLCDIAYKLRIASNDDLKRYIVDNQLKTCKEDISLDLDNDYDSTEGSFTHIYLKPSDILLGLNGFDSERNLDISFWKDNNPKASERLNEVGIMSYLKERDGEGAIFNFERSIELGNINSMINGFGVLWSEKCFNRAYNWLKEVNSTEKKNIKCMWNEAMLHFYGEGLVGSPVKKDKYKAVELLIWIVLYEVSDPTETKIVQSARKLLSEHGLYKSDVNGNNLYISELGSKFYNTIYSKYSSFPWKEGEKWPVSKDTAWLGYLFYTAYRVMPLEGPDIYDASQPIFTTSDFDFNYASSYIPDIDYDKIISDITKLGLTDNDVAPIIREVSNLKYEVECMWWNDCKGLLVEQAIVEFDPETHNPRIEIIDEGIIYPYDCPVSL